MDFIGTKKINKGGVIPPIKHMEKIINNLAQYFLLFLLINVNFAVVDYMQEVSQNIRNFQKPNTELTESDSICR